MPLYRDDAITLRYINFGEADRIVTFLSRRHGKVKAVAKGARKIKSVFAGRLEPFHKVEIFYFGKENTTLFKLNSVAISTARMGLSKDLEKFHRACYLTELIEHGLKEGDPNPQLFETANDALDCIERESTPAALDWIVRFFDIKFLGHIGYRPTTDRCVRCGGNLLRQSKAAYKNKGSAAFDVGRGGLVCGACRPECPSSIPISQGSAKFLEKIITTSFDKASRLKPSAAIMEEISKSVIAFRKSRLHAKINSERFFAK